jgi:hypothetical protein
LKLGKSVIRLFTLKRMSEVLKLGKSVIRLFTLKGKKKQKSKWNLAEV